jgi:RNA polymerase sigma factor (TIGR02999 family)
MTLLERLRSSETGRKNLPGQDSNLDKETQNLLCTGSRHQHIKNLPLRQTNLWFLITSKNKNKISMICSQGADILPPAFRLDQVLSGSLMTEVTRILSAIQEGAPHAAEQLLPLVYDELRKLAALKLAHEKQGQTLQPTALVHEAYIRLVDVEKMQHWDGRGHFFAAAAEAMRRILIEAARRKRSQRRGGGQLRRQLLSDDNVTAPPISDELLDLDEALTKLRAVDPSGAELVKLRVFAGMTIDEVAEFQGISPRTVKRTWTYARAWLGRQMSRRDDGKP